MSKEEIRDELTKLSGWAIREERLHREFVFKDFAEAFTFMTLVAEVAESMQHHPEWTNIYNTVSITLSTHDTGNSITQLDITLATAIDGAAIAAQS